LLVGDQASEGEGTVAAAFETIKHGFCPHGLALGGRRQLENRAETKPVPPQASEGKAGSIRFPVRFSRMPTIEKIRFLSPISGLTILINGAVCG
jgi:hypothetical protein